MSLTAASLNSLSRALYHGNEILVMDEPTSKLDVLAEKEIYEVAIGLKKDSTCIFVSHRLSSSYYSDVILVMDKGNLISHGNHEYLINNCETYKTMYETQKRHFSQ